MFGWRRSGRAVQDEDVEIRYPTAEVKPSGMGGPLVVVCSTVASLCWVINDVVGVDLQSVVATEL